MSKSSRKTTMAPLVYGAADSQLPPPICIDATWLLALHEEALPLVRSTIQMIRGQLVDNRYDRAINDGLNEAYVCVSHGIADAIRRRILVPVTDQSQIADLCDSIRGIITKAKSHLRCNITRPLRRVIEGAHVLATEQVSAALEAAQSLSPMIAPNESVVAKDAIASIEAAKDDGNLLIETETVADNGSLAFYLRECESLSTAEQQLDFIHKKLKLALMSAFMNFIEVLRRGSFKYVHTLSRSETKMFLGVFHAMVSMAEGGCTADGMSLRSLREMMRTRFVPQAFENAFRKAPSAVKVEFHKAVTGPVSRLLDELQSDEDIYLFFCTEIPEGNLIATEIELAVLLQWETIEEGSEAPIQSKEESLLHAAFPRKARRFLKEARNDEEGLAKVADYLNQLCHGGYPLRDKKFIARVLSCWVEGRDIDLFRSKEKVRSSDTSQLRSSEAAIPTSPSSEESSIVRNEFPALESIEIDHSLPTARERELAGKMCRAELVGGKSIEEKKILALLMSMNIIRVRQRFPKRDEAFVRMVIEELRSSFHVRSPESAEREAPVNHGTNIQADPPPEPSPPTEQQESAVAELPVAADPSTALIDTLRPVEEEPVHNRSFEAEDDTVANATPHTHQDARAELRRGGEEIWEQVLQLARSREELKKERSAFAEERMLFEQEKQRFNLMQDEFSREREEFSLLRQQWEKERASYKGIDILLQDWKRREAELKAERDLLSAEKQALEEGQEALSSEREEFEADRETLESERADLEELRAGVRNGEGVEDEHAESDLADNADEKETEEHAMGIPHQSSTQDRLSTLETMEEAKAKCADLRKQVVRCMNDIDHDRQSASEILHLMQCLAHQTPSGQMSFDELREAFLSEFSGKSFEHCLAQCQSYRLHVHRLACLIQELDAMALEWLEQSTKKKDKEIFAMSHALCEQVRADTSAQIGERECSDHEFLVVLIEALSRLEGLKLA